MEVVGEYELVEKIAEGGMGAVYRARHCETAEQVAVKVLPPHLAKNPVLLKRFEKEYSAASTLNHPNIVRALAFGYHGDSPYLVMEFVEGESLGDRLDRQGRLSETDAIQIITQVAQGLQKAHKAGMVHRDVKPDNILITRDGVAKLADLGLVKELDTDLNLTRTGRGLGTPHFMAPEQFRNAKSVDNRSDVYSLAATLYMMVTGELPFKQLAPVEAWTQKVENKLKSARELVPDLSERLDFAIRRAMRADPAQRPSSVREFIEDLTGHSTRPLSPSASNSGQDIWYLRFKDDDGVLHTAKDTLVSVRRSLKEGLFGDTNNIRASRNPDGPFELLRKLPEFRDVIIAAAIASHKPAPKRPAPPRPVAPPAPVGNPPAAPAVARPQPPMPQPVATPAPVRPPSATLGVRPPSAHLGRSGHPVPIDPGALPVAPAEPEPSFAPHIDLGTPTSSIDWGRAILFLLLAIIAGAAGFFLLPQLLR